MKLVQLAVMNGMWGGVLDECIQLRVCYTVVPLRVVDVVGMGMLQSCVEW